MAELKKEQLTAEQMQGLKISGVLSMPELIKLMMDRKGISAKQMAHRLGVSSPSVSHSLNKVENAWIETVRKWFSCMGEDFTVVTKTGTEYFFPSTITTMSQLRKKMKQVFVRLENGTVYEIVPKDSVVDN